jgi:hypothetical protein
MSNAQSPTPQSRMLHRRAAAIGSGRVAADLLQSVGRVGRGETERPGFIEQNHDLRAAQFDRRNRCARDLLLIPCRFSERRIDDPTID